MTRPVNDLVAYLAGEPGEASDRCRRALSDPSSDLSRFLATARERTRIALAEPAFRGLGLSPAACPPADLEPAPAPNQPAGRTWLPWLVAGLALLLAGLAAWAPWRAAPHPGGPVGAGEPVAARAPASEDRPVALGPSPAPEDGKPVEVPRVDRPAPGPPGAPAPVGAAGPGPAAVPAGGADPPRVADPALPVVPRAAVPAAKAGEPTPVEVLGKRLEAAEARAAQLERDNAALRTQVAALDRDNAAQRAQVTTLKQASDKAAQAHAACESRAAAQQKAIDSLTSEAVKLREQVRILEAQLKSRPPTDPGPAKPKTGVPPPDPKVPVDPNKKKP